MDYIFHPLAHNELNDSFDYYENLQKGLGIEFSKEIFSGIQRILSFPRAWTPITKLCRRCIVIRFPYGIIYSIRENLIVIVAIAQLNKKPNYWCDRLE